MSDRMRWRYGDTNPVVAVVLDTTVIEIGDLLWLDTATSTVKPLDDDGPAYLRSEFLGVAMQRSRRGDPAAIRVATTGVFEFPCDPLQCNLGILVEPYRNEEVVPQYVGLTHLPSRAIGRVARQWPGLSETIYVDIHSGVMGPLPRP